MVEVQIVIAPVPSSSALAWLDPARKLVADLPGRSDLPISIPPDVLRGFERYLDEWLWVADAGPVFRWSGEVDPEVARHLVHHWFALASAMSAERERTGVRLFPPAGDVFYVAVVEAITDALSLDDCTRPFGEQLRTSWPGVARPAG